MTDISPIEIADATDTTAGTVYYPSASGFNLGQYTHLGIEIEANDVTLSLEASMTGSSWEDITVAVVDAGSFSYLAGSVVVPAGAGEYHLWDLEGMPFPLVRLVAIYPNGTNELAATVTRRAP